MMKPHKMDFHQRAVPSPMERIGKCSPRRMITIRASALTQIRASFKSAEVNVVSGTKNAITWRIASIAKSAMASPAQVARETFVGSDGWLEAKGSCAAGLAVSMDLYSDAANEQFGFGKISPTFALSFCKGRRDVCWQARRLSYNISATGEAT